VGVKTATDAIGRLSLHKSGPQFPQNGSSLVFSLIGDALMVCYKRQMYIILTEVCTTKLIGENMYSLEIDPI
jgi:hypothetical protein